MYKQMCLKEKKLSRQVFLIHSTDEIIDPVTSTFVYLKAITSRITFALLVECSWRLRGSVFARLEEDVWMVPGGTCSCQGLKTAQRAWGLYKHLWVLFVLFIRDLS